MPYKKSYKTKRRATARIPMRPIRRINYTNHASLGNMRGYRASRFSTAKYFVGPHKPLSRNFIGPPRRNQDRYR